jgi:hypothetical protein
MTARATDLLEEPLTFNEQGCILGKFLYVHMTGRTGRLSLGTAQKRKLPQVNLTVGLVNTIDRDTLAVVAAGAAKFFRRMGTVG